MTNTIENTSKLDERIINSCFNFTLLKKTDFYKLYRNSTGVSLVYSVHDNGYNVMLSDYANDIVIDNDCSFNDLFKTVQAIMATYSKLITK